MPTPPHTADQDRPPRHWPPNPGAKLALATGLGLRLLLLGLIKLVVLTFGPLYDRLIDFRTELAPAAAAALTAYLTWTATATSPTLVRAIATVVVGGLVTALAGRALWNPDSLARAREERLTARTFEVVSHAWADAAMAVGLTDAEFEPAPLRAVRPLPFGAEVVVGIPTGSDFGSVRACASRLTPRFAELLDTRQVVVLPDPASPASCRVVLVADQDLISTPVSDWHNLSSLARDLLWADAAADCGLVSTRGEPARLIDITTDEGVETLTVEIPAGKDLSSMQLRQSELAARLSLKHVVIVADEGHAARARVLVPDDTALFTLPVAEWASLSAAQQRLAWEPVARACGLVGTAQDVAELADITRHDAAVSLTATIPSGSDAATMVSAAASLKPKLNVHRVTVRTTEQPDRVRIDALFDDVLRGDLGSSPLLAAETASIRQPAHIGLSELGEPAHVFLPGKHLLVGGDTGSGKSVAVQAAVAHYLLATRDDGTAACQMVFIDPKRVEFLRYADSAYAVCDGAPDKVLALLEEMVALMDGRFDRLQASGRRAWEADVEGQDPQMPLTVIVIDELADLTKTTHKAKRDIEEALRQLLAKGRAAGVVVIAATQRPSADVVPTVMRAQFGLRWALKSDEVGAAGVILGPRSVGINLSDDCNPRGTGFLVADGGGIDRVRPFFLSDADLDTIAVRAAALPGRVTAPEPTPEPAPEPAPAPAPVAEPAPAATPFVVDASGACGSAPAEADAAPEPEVEQVEDVDPLTAAIARAEAEVDPAGLDIARLKLPKRFARTIKELTGGQDIAVDVFLAGLLPLLDGQLGTVAPVAGFVEGTPVRLYPCGPWTLVLARNNRTVIDLATAAPALDPEPPLTRRERLEQAKAAAAGSS